MSQSEQDLSYGTFDAPDESDTTRSSADYAESLLVQIESGLNCVPKKLPELLLWDERGLDLFETIIHSQHYEGTKADGEILAEHVERLVDLLGEGGTLVELGAGSVPNKRIILDEICRRGLNVDYIAHDICQAAVSRSLDKTRAWMHEAHPGSRVRLEMVTAVYEDSFAWLKSRSVSDRRPLVVLWLGNSLIHLSMSAFAEAVQSLLEAVSCSIGLLRRVIITVDGRLDDYSLKKTYDAPDGSSLTFIRNALLHANRLLKQDVFKQELWQPTMEPLAQEPGIVWSFRSLKDQSVKIGASTVTVRVDELVELVALRRRSDDSVSAYLQRAGVDIVDIWRHHLIDWNLYVLAPNYPIAGPAVPDSSPGISDEFPNRGHRTLSMRDETSDIK